MATKKTGTVVNADPQLLLLAQAALDEAFKAANKRVKTAHGKDADLRDEVQADQKMTGLVLDMQIEIGEVVIGHDTDKAPTTSIPWLAAMGLLIRRMGLQREAAMDIIREAVTQALTLGDDAEKAILSETGVGDAVETLKKEIIDRLPRTKVRKGFSTDGVTVTIKSAGKKV